MSHQTSAHPSPSPSSLSEQEKAACLKAATAALLAKAFLQLGHDIPHTPPTELLDALEANTFEKQDQQLVNFVLVMFSPNTGNTIPEVRVLLKRAKEFMEEVDGNFEDALRGITIFEDMSAGQ